MKAVANTAAEADVLEHWLTLLWDTPVRKGFTFECKPYADVDNGARWTWFLNSVKLNGHDLTSVKVTF